MIRFCCEQCGYKIGVEDGHTGKRGKCPGCGEIFVVPAESTVLDFNCAECGQRITVSKTYRGKKVICPTCKNTLVVPADPQAPAESVRTVRFTCSMCRRQIEEPEDSRGKLIECPHCKNYVAVPLEKTLAQQDEIPGLQDSQDDTSREQFEQMQKSVGTAAIQEPEPAVERKLPWILDIFLYPTSKTGLTILGIVVVIRVLFWIVVRALGQMALGFPPFLAFFGLTWAVGIFVRIILYLYLHWYLCECIRDSAHGGIRAPETAGRTAGVGGILWEAIMTGSCLLFFAGPAFFYFIETREMNIVFWCLVVYAVFFWPMSFLAVVLFESWSGLNPILLGRSILRIFLPYCAMIALFGTVGLFIADRAPNPWNSALSLFVTFCLGGYLAMIAAHLLGWFYNRYAEKLNWGV